MKARRLKAALEDLKTVAPPERQAVFDRELDLLATSTEDAVNDPRDVQTGLTADALGFGVQAGGVRREEAPTTQPRSEPNRP